MDKKYQGTTIHYTKYYDNGKYWALRGNIKDIPNLGLGGGPGKVSQTRCFLN